MNQVSLISPISDGEAARSASPDTHADLAQQIMTTATEASAAPARRAPARHRLPIGIPVAACLAVAALIVTSLAGPDQRIGPIPVGPAKASALSFVERSGYIDVIVRNPAVDASIYRAEFAAHHLDVTLSFVPVSPSLVGTLVEAAGSGNSVGQISTITAKGRCWTGGGGNECPVGVRIPDGFHGQAQFVFGRAARPGEQYESTGSVTARGEVMHGLNYQGKTVTAVLAMLAARHATVAQYRYQGANGDICGKVTWPVPGNWRVNGADPWAPGQVMLWVGPPVAQSQPRCTDGNDQAPTPKASPTAGIPSAAGQPAP
jgi:hypothetical protein